MDALLLPMVISCAPAPEFVTVPDPVSAPVEAEKLFRFNVPAVSVKLPVSIVIALNEIVFPGLLTVTFNGMF